LVFYESVTRQNFTWQNKAAHLMESRKQKERERNRTRDPKTLFNGMPTVIKFFHQTSTPEDCAAPPSRAISWGPSLKHMSLPGTPLRSSHNKE
jgi:hypothetical protein